MNPYAGAAIGAGVSGTFGIFNNIMAGIRESEARRENYEYGEMAADSADARTRALYEDYQSPISLLRQYKEAGLSPSLMFANGTAGAGGMTQGAQGTGAAGVNPNVFGINAMEGAQLGLMQAQARKTNAEADTIEGKNTRGKQEITKLIEETNNTSLKNAFQEFENSLKMLQVSYEASTNEKKISNFFKECEYLEYKTRSAAVAADIDEKSQHDILSYLHERTLNVVADTLLKRSEKELNNAKVTLTNEQVQDLISQIATREGTLKLEQSKLEKQVEQWGLENGLTEREQNIAITKMILGIFDNGLDRGADLLESLIPFAKGAKGKK